MPYIDNLRRDHYDGLINDLISEVGKDLNPPQLLEVAGDLNYIITRLTTETAGEVSYQKVAILTGVLENAKQELYRRYAVPYENLKITDNGDVPAYKK
jgi:aromatic ring-opening dioxygenase LigB subunit